MLTLQRRYEVERASSPPARTRGNPPVLIQVPAIDTRSSATHLRSKKRRLRREVKLVGLGLLLGLPLSWLVLTPLATWAKQPTEVVAQGNDTRGIPSFAASVESISSPSSVSSSSSDPFETIPHITLQGFVLPDREVEESNHAGG